MQAGTYPAAKWYAAILSVVLMVALPRPVHGQSDDYAEQDTQYFTISYPRSAAATAGWVAGFADSTAAQVSELLAADPQPGLRVLIYATAEDRLRSTNLFSPSAAGVNVTRSEISLAADGAQANPAAVYLSFRHALVQIIAGNLTAHHLPPVLQEGLAQYMTLDPARPAAVAVALRTATGHFHLSALLDAGTPADGGLLPAPAVTQSYSVVAFLVDRYGWPTLTRYIAAAAGAPTAPAAQQALPSVYGVSLDTLAAQYEQYLPEFYQAGGAPNPLLTYDLTPAKAAFAAGAFADAQAQFTRAAASWHDLGRTVRAAEATTAAAQAGQAAGAATALQTARQALTTHQYAAAGAAAAQVGPAFAAAGLPAYRDQAQALADLAVRGRQAGDQLAQARSAQAGFNYPQAQFAAQAAGTTFAALGDSDGVAATNGILAAIAQTQRLVRDGALALAAVAALLAGIAAWRSRRTPQQGPAHGTPSTEEAPSWM
ncbi:MAG: hypothetical protein M3Z04_02925 [Chloroflexota bacterium]|nr:hypothetical protein [Chloroflexota bacterium]